MWFARAICLAFAISASHAAADCRQALALGLDVSGSVDSREYRLQLDGIAEALTDPAVRTAILPLGGAHVALTVYEWGGARAHRSLVPWVDLTSPEVLDRVAQTLRDTERAVSNPGTALGHALQTGASLLQAQAGCARHTLDISGDGQSNIGPGPENVRALLSADLTINALVVGTLAPAKGDLRQDDLRVLRRYFEAYVIGGPDAFVQEAKGYTDYARAIRRKLLRELQGPAVSLLGPTPSGH